MLPLFPDSVINAIPTAIKKIPNAMAKYNIVVIFKSLYNIKTKMS
jgi:hypothetical protein